jgi:flagellar export protein FliJ
MPGFRFRLEKVLEWRETQRDAEKLKVKQLQTALTEANAGLAQMKATRLKTELEVRKLESLSGRDLAALAAYRLRMASDEQKRIGDCQVRRGHLDEQRKRWTDAQRCYRLLEKLKDRQRVEFELEADRQAEKRATELYLGQWRPEDEDRASS